MEDKLKISYIYIFSLFQKQRRKGKEEISEENIPY